MNSFPTCFGGSFEIFGKVIDKERSLGFCSSRLEGFVVNIGMGLAATDHMGVDPMVEEWKEVVGGFEMSDMGGAGVGDQGEWVVEGELAHESDPFGQGIKDIAEGFLKLFLSVGEVKVFGEKGKVLVAGVVTAFVVVGALVVPNLFTEIAHTLA